VQTEVDAIRFELKPGRRARRNYVVIGALILSPSAVYLFAGWIDSVGVAIILFLYSVAFGYLVVQGVSNSVRIRHRSIDRRYLGVWVATPLPTDVRYSPDPKTLRYESIWRADLNAPPAIGVFDVATGQRVFRIEPDLLEGMNEPEYIGFLDQLNAVA
jgi:hypothetical protein